MFWGDCLVQRADLFIQGCDSAEELSSSMNKKIIKLKNVEKRPLSYLI